MSLKRKGCDAVGHSSYHEINMSSKNDFVDSDVDITNETCLALQLVEEDMNSESKLHTGASLQKTEGKLNSAMSYEESGDKWETRDLTDSGKKSRKIRRGHHECCPTIGKRRASIGQ